MTLHNIVKSHNLEREPRSGNDYSPAQMKEREDAFRPTISYTANPFTSLPFTPFAWPFTRDFVAGTFASPRRGNPRVLRSAFISSTWSRNLALRGSHIAGSCSTENRSETFLLDSSQPRRHTVELPGMIHCPIRDGQHHAGLEHDRDGSF